MAIKRKISGAFDLLMLFGRGMEAFRGNKRDALWSLIVPITLFFASLPFSYFYPPKGMESSFTLYQILTVVILQNIISTVITYMLVVAVAFSFKKLDKFWLFLEANNWVSVPMFVTSLPFAAAAVFGWVQRAEMDRIFVLVQCYFYIVTACIFFRAFKLNWQLAGFMTILTLLANQFAWDLLYRAEGIAKPW